MKRKLHSTRPSAFSLIEITLALGIIAFAFVSIFGLLPIGMRSFRKAMDISVGSQIAQRVIGDLQQTDFDELTKYGAGMPSTPTAGLKATRYFDDQGSELDASSSSAAIYHVSARIVPSTTLPQTGAAPRANPNLAMVTVQVANNPGNQNLARDPALVWTGAYQSNPSDVAVVQVMTYPAFISRNK